MITCFILPSLNGSTIPKLCSFSLFVLLIVTFQFILLRFLFLSFDQPFPSLTYPQPLCQLDLSLSVYNRFSIAPLSQPFIYLFNPHNPGVTPANEPLLSLFSLHRSQLSNVPLFPCTRSPSPHLYLHAYQCTLLLVLVCTHTHTHVALPFQFQSTDVCLLISSLRPASHCSTTITPSVPKGPN